MRASIVIIIVAVLAAARVEAGDAGLAGAGEREALRGIVLNAETAHLAKNYLPPELLRHYESGDYANRIVDWPLGQGTMGPEFEARTGSNRENLALDERGTIIDVGTRTPAPFIYGTPFPAIDPQDPRAAVKIVWNMYYNLWWNGNNHTETDLVWLSSAGTTRTVTQDVKFKFYDGLPPDLRPERNPDNLLLQLLANTVAPADLYGTAALSWRYRDAEKRDLLWAYVPALRRVRQVSPANRSDGFLGSDMSQDDGQFFDGKPQDFHWTLAGERWALRLVDPYLMGGAPLDKPPRPKMLPGGGWPAGYPAVPTYGFQEPRWTGAPWAPILMSLAPRKVWVVDGTPTDRYYVYGKIELWIDQENWQGVYNRKFGWDGELLMCGQVRGGPPGQNMGQYYTWQGAANASYVQLMENLKANRATAATNRMGELVQVYHIPLAPDLFDYQALSRLGK